MGWERMWARIWVATGVGFSVGSVLFGALVLISPPVLSSGSDVVLSFGLSLIFAFWGALAGVIALRHQPHRAVRKLIIISILAAVVVLLLQVIDGILTG
jgi:VIT1/CCC1 family predicted Fe2+/Mn2+ transporter